MKLAALRIVGRHLALTTLQKNLSRHRKQVIDVFLARLAFSLAQSDSKIDNRFVVAMSDSSGAALEAALEADNRRRLAACLQQLQEAEAALSLDDESGSAAAAAEWLFSIQAQLEELEADMNEDNFEEIDIAEVSAARNAFVENALDKVEMENQWHVKGEDKVKSEDDEEQLVNEEPEVEAQDDVNCEEDEASLGVKNEDEDVIEPSVGAKSEAALNFLDAWSTWEKDTVQEEPTVADDAPWSQLGRRNLKRQAPSSSSSMLQVGGASSSASMFPTQPPLPPTEAQWDSAWKSQWWSGESAWWTRNKKKRLSGKSRMARRSAEQKAVWKEKKQARRAVNRAERNRKILDDLVNELKRFENSHLNPARLSR